MTTLEPKRNHQIELTPVQQEALATILNLRKLTKETGTITTRAQNMVLRSLKDQDLAVVANALAAQTEF